MKNSKYKIIKYFEAIIKVKIIPFVMIFLLSLCLYGDSPAQFYYPDIANPFHDAFYNYDNNAKDKAKKLLEKELTGRFRNQAYINYGLVNEYENNIPEAENFYRQALKNNEAVSVIYLYSLYSKYDREKIVPLISAIESNIKSPWTDYEKAVFYFQNNEEDAGFESLSLAIDKGFSSEYLLLNDPAFEKLKNKSAFKKLLKAAKNNFSSQDSAPGRFRNEEFGFFINKPFGYIRELKEADELLKSGRQKQAVKIFSSVAGQNFSFRDRTIALFRLAEIHAKQGNERHAAQYLREFRDNLYGQENDESGFKDLVKPLIKDIILNDPYLKKYVEIL